MSTLDIVVIVAAATLAGIVNSIAGGGALIAFPALLFAGLNPIAANATTNTAMFVGTLASAGGYARFITPHRKTVVPLAMVCLGGSIAGAVLLLKTGESTFYRLVPFLILFAAILFSIGPALVGRMRHPESEISATPQALLAQAVIAIYGGYFGAGQGFAILALLIFIGFTNMHEMNGIKSFLAACTNGIAIVPFFLAGAIRWPEAIIMSVAAMAGGFLGARFAQRINPTRVRFAVLGLAYAMAAFFFWKVYIRA